MAKSWKRTEVTIEKETLVVFRSGAGARRAWCEKCGTETLMITPNAAASLAGVTTDVIQALVEAGSVHFFEMPVGVLLVCAPSLDAINHE